MPNDVASLVDLLRCRIVVGVRIYEIAGFEMVNRQLNIERGVGAEVLTVHRHHKFGGRHVRCGGNDTHRSWIARTRLDLLAIRDGDIGSQGAEVDEVVARSERGNLTSCRHLLTVILETFGNDSRIES